MATCDGVVCCLGCISIFPGVKRRVVRKIAFFPPEPPGYTMRDDPDRAEVYLVHEGEPVELERIPNLAAEGLIVDAVRMETSRQSTIYAFHFRHVRSPRRPSREARGRSRRTLIFSHGNSTDIGLIFNHMRELSSRLQVDVFAYDYSGYGMSTGQPSEQNLYSDIEAAFTYLTQECGVVPEDIVLYGQSIGSAPSVDLATRVANIGGIVLHSAMTSGLATVHEVQTTHWFDVFANVVKLKSVQAPVFIIHGTADREIPFEHGIELYEASSKKYEPWWVYEAGHNDIEMVWREDYFLRLHLFLHFLEGGDPSAEEPGAGPIDHRPQGNNLKSGARGGVALHKRGDSKGYQKLDGSAAGFLGA